MAPARQDHRLSSTLGRSFVGPTAPSTALTPPCTTNLLPPDSPKPRTTCRGTTVRPRSHSLLRFLEFPQSHNPLAIRPLDFGLQASDSGRLQKLLHVFTARGSDPNVKT